MTGEWAEIDGFPNYLVSRSGDVKSIARLCKCGRGAKGTRFLPERILKPETDKDGYRKVVLCRDSETVHRTIHRLVACAFIENASGLPQVNHINGVKSDNRVENLEWVTVSGNVTHAFRVLGKQSLKGERHGMSVLTEQQVLAIREDLRTQREIAKTYGVRPGCVSRIKSRKRWAHV